MGMSILILRTFILYAAVIIAVRIMGKRQIGELEPSELVVTILISELAAVPMQDPGIPIISGILPIIILVIIEVIISVITLKNSRTRKFFFGSSVIVIENGKVNFKELKKARVNLDEINEELRQKDVFDITQVKYAILESNGKLSVMKHGGAE